MPIGLVSGLLLFAERDRLFEVYIHKHRFSLQVFHAVHSMKLRNFVISSRISCSSESAIFLPKLGISVLASSALSQQSEPIVAVYQLILLLGPKPLEKLMIARALTKLRPLKRRQYAPSQHLLHSCNILAPLEPRKHIQVVLRLTQDPIIANNQPLTSGKPPPSAKSGLLCVGHWFPTRHPLSLHRHD